MVFMRGLLAVVIGYLVMTAGSMAAVSRLFGEGLPAPEQKTLLFSYVGLALVAAIGGFLCTLIVGNANSPAIYIAIGVMIAAAIRNYSLGVGVEPDWYVILSSVSLAIGFLVGASAAAYKIDKGQ